MALLSINRNPSKRELRQFGLVFFPLFLALVAWIVWRATDAWTGPAICLGFALIAALLGALKPAAVRPFWLAAMFVTFPIGFVISHVLIGAVYYLVLTPAGLLMRLFGHDPLQRKVDPAAATYWIRRPAAPPVQRYFRQF